MAREIDISTLDLFEQQAEKDREKAAKGIRMDEEDLERKRKEGIEKLMIFRDDVPLHKGRIKSRRS